jgi:hypothetical protein
MGSVANALGGAQSGEGAPNLCGRRPTLGPAAGAGGRWVQGLGGGGRLRRLGHLVPCDGPMPVTSVIEAVRCSSRVCPAAESLSRRGRATPEYDVPRCRAGPAYRPILRRNRSSSTPERTEHRSGSRPHRIRRGIAPCRGCGARRGDVPSSGADTGSLRDHRLAAGSTRASALRREPGSKLGRLTASNSAAGVDTYVASNPFAPRAPRCNRPGCRYESSTSQTMPAKVRRPSRTHARRQMIAVS